jgi:hypothetical protein
MLYFGKVIARGFIKENKASKRNHIILFNKGGEVMARKGAENLIPVSERTAEELREMTRKGGIRSGEVRREKAQLKSAVKLLLSLPVKDPNIKKQLSALGMSDKDIDNSILPALGLFKKACKGDSSAARLLAELNNENQVQGTTNIGAEGVNMHVTFTGKGGNNGENA